jgi:uncharacterized membrane protein YeiH
MPQIDYLVVAIEVCAIVAFAVSGLIEAARKRLDVVGVFASAFLTAFGGGTVRDLLIDRRPFFWVEYQEYLWLVFGMSVVAIPWFRARHYHFTGRAIVVPDALGLGLFSILGTSQALAAGMPMFVAVLMGVITGVVGGVLRDVVCNEIPMVFHDRQPYALCAFIGSIVFLALHEAGAPDLVSLGSGFVVTAGLRLVAVARGWLVPSWPPE